jgi:hypothetical protein
MIWPIRLPSSANIVEGSTAKRTQSLVGFLIVDCVRPKAFTVRYDFDIGALFADALFGFLRRCHYRYYGENDPSQHRVGGERSKSEPELANAERELS